MLLLHTSKALIRKEDAIEGKKEVRTTYDEIVKSGVEMLMCLNYQTMIKEKVSKDEIYTPYYSPAFKPKKK